MAEAATNRAPGRAEQRPITAMRGVGSALAERLQGCLVAQSHVEHTVPAHIGDYSDFYASIHHATAVGISEK